MSRVLLSAAEVGPDDVAAVARAVESGWLSPVGPALDRFEAELAEATGRRFAVGLSSGTAALHLGLLALGVQPGDEVWVSTLTFVATANAVAHAGASPVFFDVEPHTWTIAPDLVADEPHGVSALAVRSQQPSSPSTSTGVARPSDRSPTCSPNTTSPSSPMPPSRSVQPSEGGPLDQSEMRRHSRSTGTRSSRPQAAARW